MGGKEVDCCVPSGWFSVYVYFDKTKINLHTVNTYISSIHSNIKLNATYEEQNSIDFLDLTISCQHKKLEIDIYRKPTTTDTTINFLSNHPIEQKMAAYRYHITRMHLLPLDPDKKHKEWMTIQTIAKNNNIPQQLLQKLNRQIQQKTDQNSEKKDNKIWTTFTYHSPKIRTITNMFKNTNIGIAFRTTTMLHQCIRPKKQTPITDHERSGVYKITCNTCRKAYVGQTSHNQEARYQEQTRYIKNNDPCSAYALRILNNRHEYGNINDTMTLLKLIYCFHLNRCTYRHCTTTMN